MHHPRPPTLRETSATRRSNVRRRRRSARNRAPQRLARTGGLDRCWLEGDGRRLRHGRGGHRHDHGRRGRLARGEQRQRVDVAARIVGTSGAELDVRNRGLISRLGDRPDRLAFRDTVADRHRDRAELHERHGPAVLGSDRHSPTVRRKRARESHAPRRGCRDVRADRSGDVDSPMPGRRVRPAAVVESANDLPGGGPGPGGGHRWSGQRKEQERCCQSGEHAAKLARRSAVVEVGYKEAS